jgi:hypothetical protein
MPGMAGTFGAIENEGKLSWQAHDWQEDGTFVVIAVDREQREVSLLVQTNGLERPKQPARWVGVMSAAIIAAAIALGYWQRSLGLGFGMLVLGFGLWIGIDVALQLRAERRRRIDGPWWDEHLARCVRAELPAVVAGPEG